MPEQYIITGTITPADGVERPGIRVQAFDRDLPSLERRTGLAPQMVGEEAITDAEGRFEITFTLEQFQSGEGISQFRRLRKKNADLSFRVFDQAGQELSIKSIEALDREYPSDQVIFNAPTRLEVSIFVDAPQAPGDSEYEQFLALIAPVVADLPLVELSDEDVGFLINELGLEQERETRRSIEWLRRCALLAQESNLPIEAFYGWGRKNVPDDFAQLVGVPVTDLPLMLRKLIAFEEDDLRRTLLEAIAENIIPAGLRDRVDDILRQLKRRDQVLRQVTAQLLDAETSEVLAGYSIITFDVTNGKENLGLDFTDNQGKYSFSFYVARELPRGAPARRFSFQITTPEGVELPESQPENVNPNQPETEAVPVRVTIPKTQALNLVALQQDGQLEIPSELLTYLGTQGIMTFADIRRRGGLSRLADLPQTDPVAIRKLESLADLDRISSDVQVNVALLDKYDSVLAIADTPVSEFVNATSNGNIGLAKLKATELHIMARTQTDVLNDILTGMAANQANGFNLPAAEGNLPEQLFQQQCGCSDCEAAVSPAAYLAELLDYALKHVRNSGMKIDLPFLEDTFHQPFGDLPTDCEAVEKPVRQVRICIEVLRSYLGNRPLAEPAKEAALAKAEADYRLATYSLLLSKLGTTYEEIRRIRNEVPENRKVLAGRLGIDLTEPRPADPPGDELDRLFLYPEAQAAEPHILTEQVLEQFFGLADTTRDPLSDGVKLGDDQAQLTRWNLNDVLWGDNTDRDGTVYVNLIKDYATNVVRVELYQNPSRTKLVASGEIAADSGTVKLVPENNSRLSGVFEIDYAADSPAISIAAIPVVLSWQLQYLRTQWEKQDWPADAYIEGTSQAKLKALPAGIVFPAGIQPKIAYDTTGQVLTFTGVMQSSERQDLVNLSADYDYRSAINKLFRDSQRLPIIDPDLIGPDDFRVPIKKNAGEPDKAFDLWLERREWADTTLRNLKLAREASGFTFILEQVLGNPLPDLDALLLTLTQGGAPDEINSTKNRIADLNLTVESFSRLMVIHAKDQLAITDDRNEKVSDEEWHEVYSILTQAQKVQQFAEWRITEQKASTRLGAEDFWMPLREPKEGDWPPITITGQPLIDPAIVKITDLTEWKTGKEAIDFWNARTARLDQIPKDLKSEREANVNPVIGFDAMLRRALGHPNPGNALQHDLNTLKINLSSSDDDARNNATKQIENDLHLTVDNFNRLMAIKAKNDQADAGKKPTVAEWTEVYTILTPARKVKHEYPDWLQEEQTANLVYWKALKAKLPRWRTTLEARHAWQQALRNRGQNPIIDPEVIGPDDLKHLVVGDPAFDVWKQRHNDLVTLRQKLQDTREADANELNGLDEIIKDKGSLGIEAIDLESIDKERQVGHSIEKRLEQLNLTNGSFTYLMRVRGLAKAGQPITDSEWDAVYATLAQARKQRGFAEWREEEREKGVIHSPDLFKIPQTLSVPLPALNPATPLWLSTWQARHDWQDALQSRIDPESSVIEALRNAISTVEEATLTSLRNALIQASDASGAILDEQAEWITERLLIDAKAGGCQITTRVSQAIETIQTLIFALRTGQFKHLNTFPLSLLSDNFDEEWKWIGSYATWRAAMFVFLYPENILQPSLREKRQTPAFKTLVTNTRLRLDPSRACIESKTYADYFRDVCSLQIKATCQALTQVHSGNNCQASTSEERHLFYMFAWAPSGRVYWSVYDPQNSSGYAQSFWQEVPGFKDVKILSIVGAMPYEQSELVNPKGTTDNLTVLGFRVFNRNIHLFCVTEDKNGLASFGFVKFNLGSFGLVDAWDNKITPLKLEGVGNITSLKIVPVQTSSPYETPSFVFHQAGNTGKDLYIRKMNEAATDWDNSGSGLVSYNIHNSPPKPDKYNANTSLFRSPIQLHAAYKIRDKFFVAHTDNTGDLSIALVYGGLFTTKALFLGEGTWLGVLPGASHSTPSIPIFQQFAYAFYMTSSQTVYQRIDASLSVDNKYATISDIKSLVPHSGSAPDGKQVFAYQRSKNKNSYYYYRYQESYDKLIGSSTFRAVPRVVSPLDIPERLSSKQLQDRRQAIKDAFALNSDATPSVLTYLQEAYYFVPIHLALELQSAGQYIVALDWFRTVYDYEAKIGERTIYHGLELDAAMPDASLFQQAGDWLLDPLNPHLIAATRRYAYTRFTIMSLVRCLLDFADAEFTQEAGESLARARTLYLTALDLLNLPELQQKLGACRDLIGELQVEPGKDIPPEVAAVVGEIKEELSKGKSLNFSTVTSVVAEVNLILLSNAAWETRLVEAKTAVQEAVVNAPSPLSTGAIVTAQPSVLKEQYSALFTQPTIDFTAQVVGKAAAVQLFNGIGQPDGVNHPNNVLQDLTNNPSTPVIAPSLQFCIPPNLILKALRLHAELNLIKLRSCRNIAGIKRELEPYDAPTDTTTGLPAIGAGGQLLLPGVSAVKPTLYRYSTLVERAKQLVQLAAQIEVPMLAALEKRDVEAYNLLEARQELGLARASIQLQDLRITEAKDGIILAILQQARAQIQTNHYQKLLDEGLLGLETTAIANLEEAASLQATSADLQLVATAVYGSRVATTFLAGIAGGLPGGPLGAVIGSIVGGLSALVANYQDITAGLSSASQALSGWAAKRTTRASIQQTLASYERRRQDWEYQKNLGEQELVIGAQQITIARDQVEIVNQEKLITELQTSNTKDTIQFLTTKFTNVNLYDWMSRILEGVYCFFLQQATATAKLAQSQLAFERQEVSPAYIQADYWVVTTDGAGTGTDKAPDRKGLTGSARLLQDIYQLDQYAFNTNRRKLQLVKTLSLALLSPAEFQRFRETGVLIFATPMELFDRDFPGHYLRLIRRVRTSVIALIPPIQGIHATLTSSGLSRTVIGPDIFQTVPIRRDPEFVALTSPASSTGMFELETLQTDMLLPFEGNGVDSNWEFCMPKAANQFDYRTIADVLITIEYTALNNFEYRQQVIQTLNPNLSADRPISFRNQFADQWYDLHNPDQTKTPMEVKFQTFRNDFPPNIESIKIQQVLLYFVRADQKTFELPITELRFAEQGNQGTVGGRATPIDGIISTRRGNAGSWSAMIGKSPVGEWELALPNTEEMKNRFKDEEIEDILLVITYSGRTPDWPS